MCILKHPFGSSIHPTIVDKHYCINTYDGCDNKHDIKELQKTKLANGHILGEVLM